ncbi:hypothetical protein QUF72_22645 [Desulfobacterales bacterium HSG2]|nr:hypothetical protein [Desulfobacterales bacterium HSG2]
MVKNVTDGLQIPSGLDEPSRFFMRSWRIGKSGRLGFANPSRAEHGRAGFFMRSCRITKSGRLGFANPSRAEHGRAGFFHALLADCQIRQARIYQSEQSMAEQVFSCAPGGLPNSAGSDLSIRAEHGANPSRAWSQIDRSAGSDLPIRAEHGADQVFFMRSWIGKFGRLGFANPSRAEHGPSRFFHALLADW